MIKKRILAIALAVCLLLGLVPGAGISGLIPTARAAGESGAFGIPTPAEMTAKEQQESQITPFGTKNTFPLFVKSELFASYGWDGNKSDQVRNYLKAYDRTDNSNGGLPTVNLNSGDFQIGYNENGYSNTYTATATDGIDLGSGKEDHVAVLGYNAKSRCLELGIADRNGSKKNIVNVAQGWTIDFLDDVEIHQMNGFLSVACGDFDGDGLDSAVVFQTGAGTLTPNILEYKVEKDGTVHNSAINALDATNGPFYVVNNVFKLLNSGADAGGAKREAKNAPKVQLEAADVDKDGYDELVATVSMNDTYKWNDLKHLGTQVFLYDKLNGAWTLSARFALKDGPASKDNSAAAQSGRMVWGTSSVGNVIASDNSGAQTDFPEIVTAGLKDGESKDFNNINVVGDDTVVYSILRCTGMKSGTQPTADGNYQGNYEQISYGTMSPNEFTKSGFYESEDVSPLLQTKCFSYQGSARAEAVFIGGSVYQYVSNGSTGSLSHLYTFAYFNSGDKGIGGHSITNAQVEAVAAGNFDGNEEGREQIVCAPLLKQSGANNGFCWLYMYGYYGEAGSGSWQEQGKDYYPLFIDRKGRSYVSLTDFDYDNDSTIVTYEGVEKQWSDPEVMAILEAAPYFQDIGQGLGSGTSYQLSNSSGSSSGYSKSLTTDLLLGYEKSGKVLGGGIEGSMENNFTWATNEARTLTYTINYVNNTEENQVVVYRTPTLLYKYKDINTGEPIYLARPLDTVTSMIPVAEYNAQAASYNMELIDEANYCDPGHPATYPATTAQIESTGGKNVMVTNTPSNYDTGGAITKSISLANETESSYNYELSVSFTAYGLLFGVKAGGGLGYDYNETTATINGKEITRSGTVDGGKQADYDFNWDFATWNTEFNGLTIPVCGYTVTNTASPPAPGKNLDITSITTDSLTLQWSKGDRPASKYNIYRVIDDSTDPYLYLGSLPGNQSKYEFPLQGLDPDTSYTFVVRGATGNKESVDSLSATARTAMVGDSVTISDVADAQVAPGESAKFSAAVASCERFSSLQRFWQKREANNGVWKDLDGEHGTSLTVSNVTKDMDGDQYRLKIKATTTSASYGYYYSNAATLTVSTTATEADLTVNGTGGSGTLESPYSGSASYTTQTQENASITATVQATFAEKKGLVYQSGSAYIGRLDDGKEGTGSTYYALTKNGTEYTSGAALTQSARWLNGAGAEVTLPGKTQPYAEAKQQDGYTAIAKWNRADAAYETLWYQNGEYYTAATTEAGTTYTPAEEVSQDGIFLDTILYAGEDGTVIRAMDTYYAIDAAKTVTTVYPDDYVTIGRTIYPLASLKPVMTQEQRTIPVLKTATTPGTTLTLSAVLRKENSKQALTGTGADFVITNQSTGTPQIIHVTSGSDGKISASWSAGSPGLYSIQVSIPATAALETSLSEARYYSASGNPAEDQYRLGLNVNGKTVAGETAYGSQINLVPQQGKNNSWKEADSGIALNVTGQGSAAAQAISGKSYLPTQAGKYLFSMQNGDSVLASAALTVTPVAVTVTPTWKGEVPASASDVSLKFTGDISSRDQARLANALAIDCLYFDQPELTGAFTVSLRWKDDNPDAADLRSAYSITLGSASFYKMANTAQVSYAVEGSGGKLLGEVDTSTGSASMASGSSQSQGATLYFTATPDTGYEIKGWKINGERLDDSNDHYTVLNVGKGQQLQIEDFNPELDAKNGTLLVQVAFTNQASHITYTASEGGQITAKTSKGSDVPSDSSLAYDATVLFTAAPEEGKMVTKWMVAINGGEPTLYTWPGTEKPYLENTLALRKLDQADYTVYAEFGGEETFTVKAPALVNSRGNAVNTGSITMKTTNGNEIKNGDKLPKGKAVIYTVTLDDKNFTTLNGWEVSKDGGKTWERSGTSNTTRGYTCYAGEGDTLQVRAVVSSAQSYPLTWRIEGAPEESADFTLTAASGDTTLTSGAEYPANTPVTFTLTLPSDYEVISWTGAKQDPANSQTAALTLTKETEVVVTVAKRAPSDDDNRTDGDWNLNYRTCDRGETCPLAGFADLDPTAWYHDGVHFALANGVLEGCGDEDFRLDTPTNRAMLAVILWRMNDRPDAGDDTNFPDVPDQSWYEKAAQWAAEHGYIEGDDEGRFGPENPLTREQMATILWRYAQSKGYDVSVGESTSLENFADAGDISDYAVPAMQWAVGAGLISGQPDGDDLRLNPAGSTTRAEIATMLMRFCAVYQK